MSQYATDDIPFSEACGLVGPLRLRVEGLGDVRSEIHDFHDPFVVIGRDPSADLVLGHPEVKRHHAYLQVVDGRVFVVAFSERRPILWETTSDTWGWVEGGQAIGVGPYRIRIEGQIPGPGLAPPLPTSRAYPCHDTTELQLELPDPAPSPRLWQVSRKLTLFGHASQCRIRLSGPGVTSMHAAMIRTTQGAWIVGLQGSDRIEVDGRAVRSARLSDGAIRIGGNTIGVRLGQFPTSVPRRGLPAIVESQKGTELLPVTAAQLLPIFEEFERMQDRMGDQFQQALMTIMRMFSNMHQEQMALIREELGLISREHQANKQNQIQDSASGSKSSALPGSSTAPRTPSHPPASARPAAQTDADLHAMLTQRLASMSEERQNVWHKLVSTLVGSPANRVKP